MIVAVGSPEQPRWNIEVVDKVRDFLRGAVLKTEYFARAIATDSDASVSLYAEIPPYALRFYDGANLINTINKRIIVRRKLEKEIARRPIFLGKLDIPFTREGDT